MTADNRLEEVRSQFVTEMKESEKEGSNRVAHKIQETAMPRLTTRNYIDNILIDNFPDFEDELWKLYEDLKFEEDEKDDSLLEAYFDVDWRKNDQDEWYIHSKTFEPSRLAKDVKNDFPVAKNHDLDKVFIWMDGVWQGGAENFVRNVAKERLGNEYRTKRVGQAWSYLQNDELVRNGDWRSPNHKVNIVGGAYDYEKDKVVEKEPHDRFLHKIKYRYNPDAECPNFEEFLIEVLPDKKDRDKLLESFGLAILPDVHGKALMLQGEGANGKTLILKILNHLLEGGNTIEKGIHLLEQGFDIDNLYGKIVMTDEDMSGDKLSSQNVSFFKKMVGGGKIPAEEKFGDSYDYYPTVTPIFCANDIPPTPDRGNSFWRRWTIINFPYTFKDNPNPDDPTEKQARPESKILNPIVNDREEMEGILALIIEKGVEAYQRENQQVTGQRSPEEIKELWDEHSSPVYAFCKQYIEQGRHPDEARGGDFKWSEADYLKKDDLFKIVKAYASQRTNTRITKNRLTDALKNLDYYIDERARPRREDRDMCYGGIKLKLFKLPEKYHPLIDKTSKQSVIRDRHERSLNDRVMSFLRDKTKNGNPVNIEDATEQMKEKDIIQEEEVEKIGDFEAGLLSELSNEGQVFQPKPGKVQVL